MDVKKIGKKRVPDPPNNETAYTPTSRAQEHEEAAIAHYQRYLAADGGGDAIFAIKRLEDDLGLEPGQVLHFMSILSKYISDTGSSGNIQGAILAAFLLGVWAMDAKYEHLETKPMTFAGSQLGAQTAESGG